MLCSFKSDKRKALFEIVAEEEATDMLLLYHVSGECDRVLHEASVFYKLKFFNDKHKERTEKRYTWASRFLIELAENEEE